MYRLDNLNYIINYFLIVLQYNICICILYIIKQSFQQLDTLKNVFHFKVI